MSPIKSLVLFLALLCTIPAQAAFPSHVVRITTTAVAHEAKPFDNKHEQPAKEGAHMTNKKQWVAALLALLPLGLHRLYLGYRREGIIQCLTPVLAILGGVFLFGAPALGILLILGAYALDIWIFVDFLRICFNTLKPKDGEYFMKPKK